MRRALVLAALLMAPRAFALELDWTFVGNAENPADTTGRGSVDYEYEIGTFEVTNAHYAAFLNAVAASDPNGVYNELMGTDPSGVFGGITRSGDPGSYTYAVKSGFEGKPVVYVSFYDALRFANWLHNGQPTGPQDASTTEDGAYTITAQGIADNDITRNPGALAFLTSEDEWYKAAYYDGALALYYDYPAGSDAVTTCAVPGAIPNTANCDDATGGLRLSEVGAYTASPSPYGTFDQGGNVWEWSESIEPGKDRGLRGGNWDKPNTQLRVNATAASDPLAENGDFGFRVARLAPEPAQALLALAGGLVLAALRRRRA
jgi:formylglycine-generating enzyme required for sulfatase activity